MVKRIFGETSDAIAAHFSLAAVGVMHLHADIGNFTGADENNLSPPTRSADGIP